MRVGSPPVRIEQLRRSNDDDGQQVGSKPLATCSRARSKRVPIAIGSHVPFEARLGVQSEREGSRERARAVGLFGERENLGKRRRGWGRRSATMTSRTSCERGALCKCTQLEGLSHLDWHGKSRSRRNGGQETDKGRVGLKFASTFSTGPARASPPNSSAVSLSTV